MLQEVQLLKALSRVCKIPEFALQGILQIIDAEEGSVQNIADFRIANAVNGYLNVAGTVEPIRHEGNSSEVIRVDVGFTSFSLKIGILPQLKIPLTWPKTPKANLSGLILPHCSMQVHTVCLPLL